MMALVHGAGHTADVWRETQEALTHPSFAVNLPGRAGKEGDLSRLDVASSALSVATDIRAHTNGPVVLVGHSVSGVLLPSVAAHLDGQIEHLVFLAGITAPEGELPAEVFAPGQSAAFEAYLSDLRAEHAGSTLETLDARTGHALDSLSFSCEPMTWADLPSSVPRTFVRCLQDQIQSREVQTRLIESCRAHRVIDIDTGHTSALDDPDALATVLADVAGSASTT